MRHHLRHAGLSAQNESHAPRPKTRRASPAKLWRLHSCPKQANGALGSALQHRAGVGSAVVLLVVAVACAVVSRASEPWERECATTCATLG